jgi:Synergist-CTERM protein sorting domain-containing protein
VDAALFTPGETLPSSLSVGAAVEFSGKIDPAKYDISTVQLAGSAASTSAQGGVSARAVTGTDWKLATAEDGTATVTGTMPSSAVSFYFTASTPGGETFKSETYTVAPATTPEPSGKKSSGGGCDAGFAGLALLLGVPLFLRKKD